MNENGKTPGVYAKLALLMRAAERVAKNGRNEFHRYDYVLEADLIEAIKPAMLDIGLVLIPSQTETRIDRGVKTKSGVDNVACIWHEFTLVDTEDGSSHSFGVWGEGQDGGDKGSHKAHTGAVKYALMKLTMCATGDDPEQDRHGGQAQAPAAERVAKKLAPKKPVANVKPPATKEQVEQINNLYRPVEEMLTNSERNAVEAAMVGDTERADKAIAFLTDRAVELNRDAVEREA